MKNETDMKKNYKTPAMKVRTIRCSQMVCGSLTDDNAVVMYNVAVSESAEGNKYFGCEGYNEVW